MELREKIDSNRFVELNYKNGYDVIQNNGIIKYKTLKFGVITVIGANPMCFVYPKRGSCMIQVPLFI